MQMKNEEKVYIFLINELLQVTVAYNVCTSVCQNFILGDKA